MLGAIEIKGVRVASDVLALNSDEQKARFKEQEAFFNQHRRRYEIFLAVNHDIKGICANFSMLTGLAINFLTDWSKDDQELFSEAIAILDGLKKDSLIIAELSKRVVYKEPHEDDFGQTVYPDNSAAIALAAPPPFNSGARNDNAKHVGAITEVFNTLRQERGLPALEALKGVEDTAKDIYPRDMFLSETEFYLNLLFEKINDHRDTFEEFFELWGENNEDFSDEEDIATFLGINNASLLETLESGIKEALNILDQVRELNFFESEPCLSSFDLVALTNKVIDKLKKRHLGSFPDLTLLIEGNEGFELYTDSSFIEAIVTNLIENAIKYGLGTPVGVIISRLNNTDGVIFTVTDQGLGIREGDLRFFNEHPPSPGRLPEAKKSGKPGTGFGLFYIRLCMEKIGATLVVKSDGLDQGSTFEVRIPRVFGE